MRSHIMVRSRYKSTQRFASYIVLERHLFPPWSDFGHGSKASFNSRYDNSTIFALQQRSFHMGKGKKKDKEKEEWKILWSNKQAFFQEDKSVNRTVKSGCFVETRILRTKIISYRNDS